MENPPDQEGPRLPKTRARVPYDLFFAQKKQVA